MSAPSPARNPDGLSITELEFNEAMQLDRPILLFVMGDDHPVKKADVETLRKNEAKWSKPLMAAGWNAIPSIILEKGPENWGCC